MIDYARRIPTHAALLALFVALLVVSPAVASADTTTTAVSGVDWRAIVLTPEGYSGSPGDIEGDLVVWAGRAPGQPDGGNWTNTDVFLYRLSERSMTRLTATYYADESSPRVSAG